MIREFEKYRTLVLLNVSLSFQEQKLNSKLYYATVFKKMITALSAISEKFIQASMAIGPRTKTVNLLMNLLCEYVTET